MIRCGERDGATRFAMAYQCELRGHSVSLRRSDGILRGASPGTRTTIPDISTVAPRHVCVSLDYLREHH